MIFRFASGTASYHSVDKADKPIRFVFHVCESLKDNLAIFIVVMTWPILENIAAGISLNFWRN
jgi:hypothetical protein